MQKLYKKIKQIQKKEGLNDAEMARKIGITRQAYYALKTHQLKTAELLKKIQKNLDLSWEDLGKLL